MSLPADFDSPHEYFKQTINFLHQYSWIYQEANTCFLKSQVLTKMPQEFYDFFQKLTAEQLTQFPQIHQTLETIKQPLIQQFRQQLATLIPAQAFQEPTSLPNKCNLQLRNLKKMNVKKQHEIQRLANVIHEQLNALEQQQHQPSVLIDFGCGLGYLSEILYKLNDNLLILGLESDLYRVEAAEKRLKTYMPQAEHAIHYRQEYITENSKDFINQSVEKLLQSNYARVEISTDKKLQQPPHQMAIIGLHACADLTITSMKLFLNMSQVRHLIIMPCCYHKLQICDDVEKGDDDGGVCLKFLNFPLSRCLREVLLAANEEHSNYVTYLNRPFLRLACQQTVKRWLKCTAKEHIQHGRDMFLRAVAEAIKQETEVVIKNKERIDFTSQDVDFKMFQRLYCLKSAHNQQPIAWTDEHEQKFVKLLEMYPHGDRLAEGLTCLQTSMQKLCENLVLYDRLCYMKEVAADLNLNLNVRYEKLMDEELSPRCYVLIAEKL